MIRSPHRNAFVFVLLFALVLASGCDRSGIHPLGRDLDIVQRCAGETSAWIRSTDIGTEVFLVGATEPTDAVSGECFARGLVEHDSSTFFDFGTYTLDGSGQGEFTILARYEFDYVPSVPILQRDGSVRTDPDPPELESLAIERDGDQIIVTLDGEARRMTAVYEVIDRLDPSTAEGAEDVFRMYNLPLYTSQVRLLGFGSAAMTQYVGSPGVFRGLVNNFFTVSVESVFNPVARIDYEQFEDLSGIVVDGLQITDSNLQGEGRMRGVLDWRMRASDAPADIALEGTIDYSELLIRDGVAGGGYYIFAIDGYGSFELPYTLAADTDLRNVLPEEAP